MEQDAKVERLLEMLRRAAEQLPEEESENAKRILSKKLLRKKLESELEIKDTDSQGGDLKADCGLISDAMGKTLDGQPGSSPAVLNISSGFGKCLMCGLP